MAEGQAIHRQYLEKTVVGGDATRAKWGLAFGFIIAISFLAASVSLILLDYVLAGTIIGTVDIVGLVSAFIYGSHSRKEERRGKLD